MNPTLNIKDVLPESVLIPAIESAGTHLLGARTVEFSSDVNGTYSPSTQDRIMFNISSNSEFIDFQKSYLQADLTTTLSFEGADCSSRYLAEGGLNACFREVRLETVGGVLIDKIDRYNKFYSLFSDIFHEPSYVESHLVASGDSMDYEEKSTGLAQYKPLTGTSFGYDATGGASEQLLTGVSSQFVQQLNVNDIVMATDDNGANYMGVVIGINSPTTMNVSFGTSDFTANRLWLVKRDSGVPSMRNQAASGGSIKLQTSILLPFFMLETVFPLFLVNGGLRLVLVLERPEYVLSAPKQVISSGYSGADYTISNAKFVARMIRPAQQLKEVYIQKFKSEGLKYSYLGYSNNMNIIPAGSTGTQTITVQSSAQSLRHALCFIQDKRAETVSSGTVDAGISTYTCDSIAQKLKANVVEWSVEHGSERYPLAGAVDCSHPSNSQLLVELEKSCELYGKQSSHRFKPHQWQSYARDIAVFEQGALGGKAESQRLIFGINFSTDPSPFSGLNSQGHQIIFKPVLGSAYQMTSMAGTAQGTSPLYFHTFLGFDKVLVLSESAGITTMV